MNKLEINNISKTYKDVCAVDNITLSLENGIYGLIGHNGAGKSTLIRMLTLIEKSDTGNILYNEKNIQSLGNDYRSIIGLMPQNQGGYDNFSGLQFLYYLASLKGMNKKEANAQIPQYVKEVNLEDAIHRKIKTYSGGMKQRLMFAQALLNNPKILIMDEPTAGLDPYERIRLRNLVSKIAEDKIVIIATHVMQDVEAISNGVLIIRKGKLVFSGTNEKLVRTLENKVFEKTIESKELEVYQSKYLISRLLRINDTYNIRYVSDDSNRNMVVPNLEDAYLYYMGKQP